jgi:amino acid transporter
LSSAAAQHPTAGPRLRRDAVGLTGAVIMSAAIMGSAVSTFFNPQFSMPFSGEATPFVYLACLIAASGVGAMARYVTRGLGPRAGFITSGLMFVAYALLPPAEVGPCVRRWSCSRSRSRSCSCSR